MHYADGSSAEVQVHHAPDGVGDWYHGNGTVTISEETIGWRGANAARGDISLSELVWENPYPDKTIATIDFISAKAAAAPLLVGITLE